MASVEGTGSTQSLESLQTESVSNISSVQDLDSVQANTYTIAADEAINYIEATTSEANEMDSLKQADDRFVGFFHVPDANITVPLYHIDAWDFDWPTPVAQDYTDKENSAVMLTGWGSWVVIADHVNQAFRTLSDVSVGTICYVNAFDGSEATYQCIETGIGIDDTIRLYDQNGIPWEEWQCDLITQTCYHAIPNGVFIAKWQEIS